MKLPGLNKPTGKLVMLLNAGARCLNCIQHVCLLVLSLLHTLHVGYFVQAVRFMDHGD